MEEPIQKKTEEEKAPSNQELLEMGQDTMKATIFSKPLEGKSESVKTEQGIPKHAEGKTMEETNLSQIETDSTQHTENILKSEEHSILVTESETAPTADEKPAPLTYSVQAEETTVEKEDNVEKAVKETYENNISDLPKESSHPEQKEDVASDQRDETMPSVKENKTSIEEPVKFLPSETDEKRQTEFQSSVLDSTPTTQNRAYQESSLHRIPSQFNRSPYKSGKLGTNYTSYHGTNSSKYSASSHHTSKCSCHSSCACHHSCSCQRRKRRYPCSCFSW